MSFEFIIHLIKILVVVFTVNAFIASQSMYNWVFHYILLVSSSNSFVLQCAHLNCAKELKMYYYKQVSCCLYLVK